MTPTPSSRSGKEGAALLVALWVLIILSLIVGAFAFETILEARLTSRKRKAFHAEMAARSGVEYARAILDARKDAKELEIEDMTEEGDAKFMMAALYVKRGLTSVSRLKLDEDLAVVTIRPAENGRNVNLLTREQWKDIFETANVPATEWDVMLDCLKDWIDADDNHGLNGAESDDPFYKERGYPVKNGPLDSVEELLLIKGWGPEILYGKPADEEGDAIYGIADILTVWGDGKVNLNTADTNTLLSYVEYEDWELASVMEARLGEDGVAGTPDDGLRSLGEVNADPNKFKLKSDFIKIVSLGDSFGVQYEIECILLNRPKNPPIVYWKEGPLREHANAR